MQDGQLNCYFLLQLLGFVLCDVPWRAQTWIQWSFYVHFWGVIFWGGLRIKAALLPGCGRKLGNSENCSESALCSAACTYPASSFFQNCLQWSFKASCHTYHILKRWRTYKCEVDMILTIWSLQPHLHWKYLLISCRDYRCYVLIWWQLNAHRAARCRDSGARYFCLQSSNQDQEEDCPLES